MIDLSKVPCMVTVKNSSNRDRKLSIPGYNSFVIIKPGDLFRYEAKTSQEVIGFLSQEAEGLEIAWEGSGETITSFKKEEGEVLGVNLANPKLQVSGNGDEIEVNGVMAHFGEGDIKKFGFPETVKNMFGLKITVVGADDTATVTVSGDGREPNKYTKKDFDGDDFIYVVFRGDRRYYIVRIKATADSEERVIHINMNASLAQE